jgi:ATP-binding cassette subfamily F protein 3
MAVARSGLASLLDLQREMEEAAQELAEAEDDDERARATRRYDELHHQIQHQDAYSVEHRVEEILTGLGFSPADFDRPARTFSGGQQSRLMLAKLLLESPDVMLLDEPSNHLDIETTAWLENYLARQSVAMVVVSHDRYFLDKVVTRVWELYEGKIDVYPGNYTQYWRLRTEKAKVLERQAERQAEKIADLEAYIRKYGAGQRAKQAKDREKKLERIERVETMRSIVGPVMGFGEVERAGDVVIEARHLSKAYDRPLFADFNLQVQRGQCVGVMGPNGSGKTTLVKTLIGREKADRGEVRLGHKVHVGYHDQGLESLPPQTTVLRAVWPDDDPDWVQEDVRDLLARFGLSGDIVFQTVGQLSGGETAKAALARLAATAANVLVMDEPTNHLDIWSCDALERSIEEFEGTVLVVTHDRYFLNQVADRLIVLGGGKARVIEGDYETYQRLAQQEADAAEARAASAAAAAALARDGDRTRPEKRRRKFPYRKTDDLEREIAEVEAKVSTVEDLLGQPATWRDPIKARTTQQDHEDLKARLARLYEHWEEAVELNS